MGTRVLVDANVIVSKTQFDWLFHLRQNSDGVFQVHSTEDIFAEALKAVRRNRPTASGNLITRRLTMIRACVDEVLDDFPGDLPFSGEDVDDYHVHAAAIGAGADMILTSNDPSDFTSTPDSEPYEIIAPDDFFMFVVDMHPSSLLPATLSQWKFWRKKPDSKPLYTALEDANCPRFAGKVRTALREIALRS
ncbi:MAG TPA: PIN domain-containing protein [Candidatus Corynebacterium avicola]|uniref:PIN domain-containing protein n=1 Tax=Candidatus Corynebacterium avicola TaxID=2838527 RepID=A0A9D1UJW3_9CORY|nr:PIN domain-containing protein [Candidatus Corynebacterium avicola]